MAKLISSLNQTRRNVMPGERRFAKRLESLLEDDLQQEQLARNLGGGHRVIHGFAGSVKYEFTERLESMTEPAFAVA